MPFYNKDLACVRAKDHCSRCHRAFTDKESLIQHLKHNSKHFVPDVPESCIHCGRSFSCTEALIQHLNTNRHHLRDLHHAACTGKFQVVDSLMRNEYANEPVACEAQTHFRSSLLYLRKIASANPSSKTISMTWNLFSQSQFSS